MNITSKNKQREIKNSPGNINTNLNQESQIQNLITNNNSNNNINESLKNQKKKQCQVCGKQAHYVCSQCTYSGYCTRQHQVQHWRVHKQSCKVLSKYHEVKIEQQMQNLRYSLRKNYYTNFSSKVYDQALKNASELVREEHKHLESTRFITNQLEYGAAVCLLCRILITLKKEDGAKIQMKKYLNEKKHFLEDLRDIPSWKAHPYKNNQNGSNNIGNNHNRTINGSNLNLQRTQTAISNNNGNNLSLKNQKKKDQDSSNITSTKSNSLNAVSNSGKQFFDKKISLIAGIANILHFLKMDCIEYYDIYTSHVQKFFGQNSQQLSNCYFMIGCYYKQNDNFNKAIACFIKAASLRTSKAGDCYLNIGILIKFQGKINAAIQMLQLAINLKQQQFGQNSSQVAQIRQSLAHIHSQNKNFSAAMRQLQKALKIRCNNMTNQKQTLIKKQIRQLYDQIKSHLEAGTIQNFSNKPQFFLDLKNSLNNRLKNTSKGQQSDSHHDQSFKSEQKRMDIQNLGRMSKPPLFQQKIQKLFKLNQVFMQKLNKTQTLRLSQLQLQLQKCKSQYAIACAVGRSDFIRTLYNNNTKLYNQIKHQNQKLFQLINLEQIMNMQKQKNS